MARTSARLTTCLSELPALDAADDVFKTDNLPFQVFEMDPDNPVPKNPYELKTFCGDCSLILQEFSEPINESKVFRFCVFMRIILTNSRIRSLLHLRRGS